MSWRDTLVPASFAGVPFLVDGREMGGSHLQVKHQYAALDGAYYEQTARDVDTFAVDAFLIGENYHEARQALVIACQRNPSGEYVDPFTGERLWCALLSWSITEGVREGLGYAGVTLTLAESIQDPNQPEIYQEAPSTAKAAKALSYADSIAASDYAAQLDAAADYASGVAATVSQLADEVTQLEAAIYGPLSGALASAQEAASAVVTLRASLASLAAEPADLWAQATLVLDTLGFDVLDSMTLAHLVPAALTFADPGEQAAADAARAVALGFQRMALTAQGSAMLGYGWDSADDALAARQRWARLHLAAGLGLSGSEWAAWVDARIATASALDALALTLPRLLTVTVDAPTSTLELAHRYYQDASRADEIASRNPSIVHPGFVVGTITILQPGE